MLPDGMDKLKKAVKSVDAKLVVIDPVDEFFDGSLANDDFARRAITPLSKLARSKNLAIVLVRHLTKTGTSRALYRGRGSIRLAGAARSTLLLAQDPLDTGRRILAQSKSSLGPQAPSLAFELVDRNGYPTIHWLGESPISADDLVQGGGPHDGPMLREAMESLVRILADGKLLVKDAKQSLRDADVSDTTSRRARRRLGIRSKAEGSGPGSKHYCALPEESEEVEHALGPN